MTVVHVPQWCGALASIRDIEQLGQSLVGVTFIRCEAFINHFRQLLHTAVTDQARFLVVPLNVDREDERSRFDSGPGSLALLNGSVSEATMKRMRKTLTRNNSTPGQTFR